MQLKDIEEEEPQLSIVWNEKLNEINIRLMGEIPNRGPKAYYQGKA